MARHLLRSAIRVGSGSQSPTISNRQPTPLLPSRQAQRDETPRSAGTTKSSCGSPRRSPNVHTIEKDLTMTSVFGLGRHATGKEVDNCRLRLLLAIEPVVGDHSSGKDHSDPERQ